MKAIIFAGGSGTRLWPLSRKKSPKQFEKIIGDKSTLQLAIERIYPEIKAKDIFISTNQIYKNIIVKQLPQIPKSNIIFEPVKKDVGPAIALSLGLIAKKWPDEPILILWSDHLVKKTSMFKQIIKVASEEIKKDPKKIIFISHKPRFPSTNLGYIHFGDKLKTNAGINFFEFKDFKYRPDEITADKFFKTGKYAWNLGYFITSAQFIIDAYRMFEPDIFINTQKILKYFGTKEYQKILEKYYQELKSISFDNAILEKLNKNQTMVIVEDIGWSDVGSWEALKEALQTNQYENITKGEVFLENVKDSLIYNYDNEKLIVGIDLNENIIVNTKDVILITKKTSMSKVKKLVEKFSGTKHDKLI